MAVNVTVYDLDNYPDNNKSITVNHSTLVPIGYEGDEQWVMSFTTTAYSDNTNTTAIQDIYVRETRAGWSKSSGLVGTGGKFTVVSGTGDSVDVKMDNSSQAYTIELEAGANLGGDVIAADMQLKIRAVPDSGSWSAGDAGYELAYKNCIVDYTDGKFWIVSGSVGQYYTGNSRSSVRVTQDSADTLYATLGFDLGIESETLAAQAATESLVSSSYTNDTTPLAVDAGTGVQGGDVVMITDGTNTDYFTAVTGTTDTSIIVPTIANNGFTGISNNYTLNVSKVQVLSAQDPDSIPKGYYDTVDSISRWGIMSVANQIDFSS